MGGLHCDHLYQTNTLLYKNDRTQTDLTLRWLTYTYSSLYEREKKVEEEKKRLYHQTK